MEEGGEIDQQQQALVALPSCSMQPRSLSGLIRLKGVKTMTWQSCDRYHHSPAAGWGHTEGVPNRRSDIP